MFSKICTIAKKMRELMLANDPPASPAGLKAAAVAACDVEPDTVQRPPVQAYLADLAAAVFAGKKYSEAFPDKAAGMASSVVEMFDAACAEPG